MSNVSNEKTTTTEKTTGGPPMLPVRKLNFDRDISIPGRGMCSGLGTGDPEGKSWRIDLEPRLRAFRFRFYPSGRKEHEGEAWVPLERVVSWEFAT